MRLHCAIFQKADIFNEVHVLFYLCADISKKSHLLKQVY